MAEASIAGVVDPSPESKEHFHPGRGSQSRKGRPKANYNRSHSEQHAGPHLQYNNESATQNEPRPTHSQGPRGRGRGIVGASGNTGRPGVQNVRWKEPDKGANLPVENFRSPRGSGKPRRPQVEMSGVDSPNWRRPVSPGSSEGSNHEERKQTHAQKPRKFHKDLRRGGSNSVAQGHPHRIKHEESSARKDSVTPVSARPTASSEPRDGNRSIWREGEVNPKHRKKGAGLRRCHQEEREQKETESRSDQTLNSTQSDLQDKEVEMPGGRRGYSSKTPLENQSQRPANTFDQWLGQRRTVNVSKSKETHTGSLIEQLSREKYECMVCCDVVRVMVPVWSCKNCYHVFHLNCIKKWARSPASQVDENGGWRCPACQNVEAKVPNSYKCFCGKETNPEWHPGEIPHSCGEVCRKNRSGEDCSHPCNILCHPGPCPQCPAYKTKSCLCGKTSYPIRCGQSTSVRCDQVCGAKLNCGEHLCDQVCHSGSCQPCQLPTVQVCYCGAVSEEVQCGTNKETFDGFGYFSCKKACEKLLDCSTHRCQQECHPGPCSSCPWLPRLVHSCPCGQTPLSKLLELGYPERRSCVDPIPSCSKTCGKPLPCGSSDTIHTCEILCHEGDCGPCSLMSTVKCRCGLKTKEVPCSTIHTEAELEFTCDKRCNKKRSCGRHKCGKLCCVDKDHRCSLICGYKLNCGLHRCQEVCHRGNCHPCWQTSFDELSCYCGETVMFPPIPCGTKPPECKNLCTRRHECDHPVFHNCHSEENCPPCTYLTTKWCMGNHEQRSNIPCHLSDISCGLPCGLQLPCGTHQCQRICHKGECLTDSGCNQPCCDLRAECGHPCAAPCHMGSLCPRTTCSAKFVLQCDCGRRKETVICADAASSYQRTAAIAMARKLSDLQLGNCVDIGQLTKKELKRTRLECDQECAALERNRRLAEALQIDQSSDPFNIRSSCSKYTDSLKEDARKDVKFVNEVEEVMKNLIELVNKGKQPRRSKCFPPMNREHRKIIHELAEAYGVESVSYDSEPKRNVAVTAVRGKSACPSMTLGALIEKETMQRAPPPIAHVKQASGARSDSQSAPFKEEPAIDYFDVQD